MYIPFEQVTVALYGELQERGYTIFVLQRFVWPSVGQGKGFMLSAYADRGEAEAHAAALDPKEGKLLTAADDDDKIQALLQVNSGYRLFLNKLKDTDWNKRMLKWYQSNIVQYLRSKTRFKRTDPIDILFTIEDGRVWATISSGDSSKKVAAIDLIL